MHLTEHSELSFVKQGVGGPSLPRAVAETDGIRIASEPTTSKTAKVKVPIDDDDVEGRNRWYGGEHGSEEIRRGVILCGVDRLGRSLECPKGLVP